MSKRVASLTRSYSRALSSLSRNDRGSSRGERASSSIAIPTTASIWWCTRAVALVPLLALLAIATYIFSLHRLGGLAGLSAVLTVLQRETVQNGRCKLLPDEHYNLTLTSVVQRYRCLPNTFLIGASKSGTTSLTDYLSQHSRLRNSFIQRRVYNSKDGHREVHRLDRDTYPYTSALLELGDEWASSPIVLEPETPVIHYTPHYLYAPTVPFDLRRLYPPLAADALRFVVLLRNPVERALSSYWFHHSKLLNKRADFGSIPDFIDGARAEMRARKAYDSCMNVQLVDSSGYADHFNPHHSHKGAVCGMDRLGAIIEPVHLAGDSLIKAALFLAGSAPPAAGELTGSANSSRYEAALCTCFGHRSLRSPLLGHRHVDKGIYYDQLIRWFTNFPQRRFLVVLFDDFISRPREELHRILRFVGLPESEALATQDIDFSRPRLVKPNSLYNGNGSSSLPEPFRSELRDFFRPYNRKLEVLLKRSLAHWD